MKKFLTAAFYKFVDLSDFEEFKPKLLACCEGSLRKALEL